MTRPAAESGAAARRERLTGAALALAGVLVFHFTVIGVDPALTVGQAVAPWPDGAEYLDAAVSLLREGVLRIHIAGELHPPRFPFGYSLLIAGALACGVEPEKAPYLVNQLGGLALLALVGFPLWRRRSYVAAGLAVLLLATLPAFVVLARSPMSEISSTVPVVAGALLLVRYSCGGGRVAGGLGAALLAFSACLRTGNVLLQTLIPAAVVARHGRSARLALRDLMILAAFAAAGLAPLAIYQAVTFGGVARTGYGYWLGEGSPRFGISNLSVTLPYYWRELTQRESVFTTANLYGPGSYVGPAFVLLLLLAPFGLACSRRFYGFVAAGLASGGALLLFSYADARFGFPLLVLATPVAAASTVGLWRRSSKPAAVAAAVLAAAAAVGWPARGGGLATLGLLHPAMAARPSAAYRASAQLRRLDRGARPLILTDLPPPYLHAILAPESWVAPLFDGHDYRYNSPVFSFGAADRRRLVALVLAEGRSVWVLTHSRSILKIGDDLAAPAGYLWEIVARDRDGGGIARLVAASPEESAPAQR